MSEQLIRKAFETRLATWAAAQTPALPVAYQNAAFSLPKEDTAANGYGRYVRGFLLPGQMRSRDLLGKHREYVGIYQISLVLALNRGTRDAMDLTTSLDAVFSPGPPLVQDGFNVWITDPISPAAPLPETDRYVVPVSVYYKAENFLS